jgi:hypothetical protein
VASSFLIFGIMQGIYLLARKEEGDGNKEQIENKEK